ncbi:MAG: hypothetical protein KBC64_01635 [Simkaniaceae bacterium]|nr:hypothetical protein [Simkaniaceae bacterium]
MNFICPEAWVGAALGSVLPTALSCIDCSFDPIDCIRIDGITEFFLITTGGVCGQILGSVRSLRINAGHAHHPCREIIDGASAGALLGLGITSLFARNSNELLDCLTHTIALSALGAGIGGCALLARQFFFTSRR